MKKNNVIYVPLLVVMALCLSGCIDVAYTYDIENNHDDYTSQQGNGSQGELTGIDVSMYNYARVFPGLVDTLTERRVSDTLIRIDMGRKYVERSVLGAQAVPEPLYSTGLYAGAGELITVELESNIMGLTLQIGSHMDDLGSSALLRQPLVVTRQAIYEGTNTIRNPFGGYIWIRRDPNVTGAENFPVRIKGAYSAPDFIKGVTEPVEWAQRIRSTTVPWLEVRGERVAFSLSRGRIEEMLTENPAFAAELNETISRWDEIMESYYEYYVLSEGHPENKYRQPEFQERIVTDIQLADNVYMRWQGQPLATLNTSSMVEQMTNLYSVSRLRSTAVLTALGNNYVMSSYWGTLAEIGSLMPYAKLATEIYDFSEEGLPPIFVSEDIDEHYRDALGYAAADSVKLQTKDGIALDEENKPLQTFQFLPYAQLGAATDWQLYIHLNRRIKEGDYMPGSSLSYYLAQYLNSDLNPFFEQWGIATYNETVRAQLAAFPPMEKEWWKYDVFSRSPLANVRPFDPDEHIHRHLRNNWQITALDGNYNDNWHSSTAPQNIIDNQTSHWHSLWGASYTPVLPYYIIIDMQQELDIDGIYTSHWGGERPIRRLIIQGTNDILEDFYDREAVWTDIAQIRPYDEQIQPSDNIVSGFMRPENNQKIQFYEFVNPVRYRNLRLVIPENTYNPDGGNAHADMAEFGTYIKPKK